VVLTEAGLALADTAVTEHVANENALLAALTRAERRTLDELLHKLLASMER
jgi:DNA-binding MarR family transcriptional regulator